VVTGTGTGVGKTYFTALTLRALREAGVDAVGYKPVCCGGREDAVELWEASGRVEEIETLNPVWLRAPVAPLVAAELDGVKVDTAEWRRHAQALEDRHEMVLMEGVGGWEVPLAKGEVFGDLAGELGWPVILVVGNQLGALNHTLLTAKAIAAKGLHLAGLVLNHLEEERDVAMVSNRAVLEEWVQADWQIELMPGQDWLDAEVLEGLGVGG
jgi:dethiobiotin synthetase